MKLNMLNTFEIYNKILKENLILEDIEGKNINRAEKFIKQNYPDFINKKITLPNGETKVMSTREWTIQIRNDIPSSRLPKTSDGKDSCKFLLGVTRLYFSFTEGNQDEIQGKISQLEKILKLIVDSHADEYDKNLNGLSYDELNQKFSLVIKQNLEKQEKELKNQEFIRDKTYEIIQIPNFKKAKEYEQFTKWCIVKQENMYDSYTKDGLGIFYFCLKNGYEKLNEPDNPGEGAPLDEYGKSMFAISVNEDGSLNSCTCRWNHDHGGNDHILKDTTEISKFFGVNFFETFKPREVDEILNKYKKDAIPSEIAKKHNVIETKYELIIIKNKKIIKYKKCYDADNIKCFAYDKFYWFDTITGEEIDPPEIINRNFYCTDYTQLISLEGAPKIINGKFDCSNCTSLISLEGAPEKTNKDFYCSNCTLLTSLEGAPKIVNGYFNCVGCTSLTSLEGAPKKVNLNFDCSYCTSLTSLEGAPEEVDGNFNCSYCTSLTSLEGSPKKIHKDFTCSDCTSLVSLEGAPEEVDGNFNCSYCTSLTSLEGAPKEIGEGFYCSNCISLTSLKGAPKKTNGWFSCSDCPSLTSLEGAPEEVGSVFYCSWCSSLASLNGAPRVIKQQIYVSNTKIAVDAVKEYKEWLKTNPTENYLVNTSIDESYVKYISNSFKRLF